MKHTLNSLQDLKKIGHLFETGDEPRIFHQFDIISHLTVNEFSAMVNYVELTEHMSLEREIRLNAIDLEAKPEKGFISIVDKGHRNGLEIHALFSDGSIRIFNYRTGKLITIKFARVAQMHQIKDCSLYPNRIPSRLYQMGRSHERTNKNNLGCD